MNLDEAIVLEDRRFDYGETRFLAYAPINGRFPCPVVHDAGFHDPGHWPEKGQQPRKKTL